VVLVQYTQDSRPLGVPHTSEEHNVHKVCDNKGMFVIF
jgi:hypothetical protein